MAFLFVDTERVWRGGQDQLLTLLKGLYVRGHEIHLCCHPRTLLEDRAREVGIHLHPVSVHSELGLIAFLRLLAIMRRIRPQVVAFNTPRAILIGALAGRIVGIPGKIIFRRVNFPLKKSLVTRLKYTWGIDLIVAISQSIQAQLVRGGVPIAMIRTVYEGIDLRPYPLRQSPKHRDPGMPLTVGCVAFMSEEKGHRYLVEAASRVADVAHRMRFVMVGDGDCRTSLEGQVKELGLEGCFQFVGFQEQTAEYMQSFDLFVLPSLSEGLSSAILAAMAASLPVIATHVGGIPELVRHKENGLLVPPADPAALAGALEFLARDPMRAFAMGQRGRQRIEEEFTLERKILETEKLCAPFLARRPSASRTAHA